MVTNLSDLDRRVRATVSASPLRDYAREIGVEAAATSMVTTSSASRSVDPNLDERLVELIERIEAEIASLGSSSSVYFSEAA